MSRCSRCKSARYCSSGCQSKHWVNGHRELCLPATATTGAVVVDSDGMSVSVTGYRELCIPATAPLPASAQTSAAAAIASAASASAAAAATAAPVAKTAKAPKFAKPLYTLKSIRVLRTATPYAARTVDTIDSVWDRTTGLQVFPDAGGLVYDYYTQAEFMDLVGTATRKR